VGKTVTEKNQGFGLNASYVEMLRAQWTDDPASVLPEWRRFFEKGPADSGQGMQATKTMPTEGGGGEKLQEGPKASEDTMPSFAASMASGVQRVQLLGVAKRIALNMETSLSVPTATSSREIPVKVLEENRAIINDYLEDDARPRCSYTHLVAYAIVKALMRFPKMNATFYRENDDLIKDVHDDISLGFAIDLPARDGGRSLVVPNLKQCQKLKFMEFFEGYNAVLNKARQGKLQPSDFAGTTISLTNPGGFGTLWSFPRLMEGQGLILAIGTIGYSAQYEAAAKDTLRELGIGKVMMVTSTYDHRIIQGAESGQFLAYLHELLIGEHGFYDEIFASLEIPHLPFRFMSDTAVVLGQRADLTQTARAMRVSQLIHAYRVRGYLLAHVDPLHLILQRHPELDLETYGLTVWDLDREFETLSVLPESFALFREILARLRSVYCRRMSVEYMYIDDMERKLWIQRMVENKSHALPLADRREALDKLLQAENFELFLHKRYLGHKRFSMEGAEVTIAMLAKLLDCAAMYSVSDVTIGMAHRGRLNVLANIVGKSYEAIFAEFEDIDPKTFQGSGDVKYHMGAVGVHRYRGPLRNGVVDEREVRVELACNPSHLEAVDPVVEGFVRAKQDISVDRAREKTVAVLLHGDAAFAGQGIVYETLQLSNLQGYRTGGTIHIVINNQIGYTTPPEKARSSRNCSDIARAIGAPVFRINGDDPEAAMRALTMAFEYRMEFKRDVVIDVVCYRRHGHNEGDEPSFTQPILYKAIEAHPTVTTLYGELLVRRGDITRDDLEQMRATHLTRMEKAFDAVRAKGRDAVPERQQKRASTGDSNLVDEPDTRVSQAQLRHVATGVTYEPKQIQIHPRVKQQILDRRRAMVFEGKPGIDFGMAEILAYGTLLLEGIPVRLSGQDCGRGTFAHRHAVLYDVNDGRPYIPLNHLERTVDEGEEVWHPGRFRVYDSPLSEAGVMGFEYGYSVAHPKALVLWEAQFGDFFNGAQIQVDQFLCSSEAKWNQKSRLVLLLPHGYDGQGPEHSSGRMERFLQLCAEDNMRVANCSSASQYFHLLRRQAKQPKKPLIIFTHKSILRLEEASASVEDLTQGRFLPVIADKAVKGKKSPKCLIFCTGKLYWELSKKHTELAGQAEQTALCRVEQLYPFPASMISDVLKDCPAKDVVWVQEEPRNNGAFTFVKAEFAKLGVDLRYIGRQAAASPATGSARFHKKQQESILTAAFAEFSARAKDVEVAVS
jgi:2-oxoglutarate dehydrogenase E1 component